MGAPVGPGFGIVSHALTPICTRAGYQHHASVVVSHLKVGLAPVRFCVGFDEDQISGHQLLDRSRIEWGSSGFYGVNGTAVCQVDNEPAGYSPDCLQAGRAYWSVWAEHYAGGWTVSSFGIDATTVRDGDSEGFRYADSNSQAPPDSPASTCPAPAPKPAVMPSAVAPPLAAAPSPAGGSARATAQPSPAAPKPPAPAGAGAAASPTTSDRSLDASPGAAGVGNAVASGRRPAATGHAAAVMKFGRGDALGVPVALAAVGFLVLLLGLQLVLKRTHS